jgi:hypothetical protein
MQVLNSAHLEEDERRLRRAAVSRLTAMLEIEMPPSQRQRVSQPPNVRRSPSGRSSPLSEE